MKKIMNACMSRIIEFYKSERDYHKTIIWASKEIIQIVKSLKETDNIEDDVQKGVSYYNNWECLFLIQLLFLNDVNQIDAYIFESDILKDTHLETSYLFISDKIKDMKFEEKNDFLKILREEVLS